MWGGAEDGGGESLRLSLEPSSGIGGYHNWTSTNKGGLNFGHFVIT